MRRTESTLRQLGARGLFFAVLAHAALLWPLPCPAQEPLTFEAALHRMQQCNEALMAGEDEVRRGQAEREAARGLKLPKADLHIQTNFLDADVTTPFDPLPIAYKMQNKHFTKAELAVTWPVYTGGRVDAANRAAEAKTDEARAQLQYTGDQLVSELAQRYFGVCLAERACQATQMKVRAMEEHALRAKRLMEEGIISKAELLNAEVAVANAHTELSGMERDVAIAREGLANTMAWSDPVEPTTGLFLLRDLEELAYFEQSVGEDHPVLSMLSAKQAQAHQGVRAEQGATLPRFYVFGMKELIPYGCSVVDPKWAFGMGGEYTLFDGAQGRSKIAAAKALEQRVDHLRRKYERDLRSLTVKRYEELEKARDQYDSLEKTLALTAENLRVRTRAFEEGVTTSLEVVDATVLHARAQLGRLKAAYDYDTALFQLLEASGLTQRHGEYLARAIPVPENDTFPAMPDLPPAAPLEKQPRKPEAKQCATHD